MISHTIPKTPLRPPQTPIQRQIHPTADLDLIRRAIAPTGYQLHEISGCDAWHLYNPSRPMPRRVFLLRFNHQGWTFQPVADCCDRAYEELRLIIFHALQPRRRKR